MDINLIIGLAGILSTVSMIVLGLIKFPAERKKLNAESAEKFAQAAKLSEEAAAMSAIRALNEATRLDEYKLQVESRICELENKIVELQKANEEKDTIIESLQEQLNDVQDWAERLVHQVKSLGGDPVPLKPKRKVGGNNATNK